MNNPSYLKTWIGMFTLTVLDVGIPLLVRLGSPLIVVIIYLEHGWKPLLWMLLVFIVILCSLGAEAVHRQLKKENEKC